jgi:hypothetical protein
MKRFGSGAIDQTQEALYKGQLIPMTLPALRYANPESELSSFVFNFPIRISTPYLKVPLLSLKGSLGYTKCPSQRIGFMAWTLS